jgi:hypothetical protein
MNLRFVCLIILVYVIPVLAGYGETVTEISVTQAAFNPAAGQSADISFRLETDSDVIVKIANLNGGTVRTLLPKDFRAAGSVNIQWDGKNDDGEVVTDGAFALQIETMRGSVEETYAPQAGPIVEVAADYYDRMNALLGYTLAAPSAVTITAGRTERDPVTGSVERKPAKIIARDEARVAGSVIQVWNGLDHEGSYLPDLPDYYLLIEARQLPENAMITYGNPSQ